MEFEDLIKRNDNLNEEGKLLAIKYNKIGTGTKICIDCEKLMCDDKFYRGNWRCKPCYKKMITCVHNKVRSQCKDCNPIGYKCGKARTLIRGAMIHNYKRSKATDLLGCTIQEYRQHISDQFTDGMSWNNYGKWHIDHIIPLQYNKPTLEEVFERLHYTNTQPMWAADNIRKSNKLQVP